jgi:hypothetical protein
MTTTEERKSWSLLFYLVAGDSEIPVVELVVVIHIRVVTAVPIAPYERRIAHVFQNLAAECQNLEQPTPTARAFSSSTTTLMSEVVPDGHEPASGGFWAPDARYSAIRADSLAAPSPRYTDVASSLATSERCFSALAHRGFLPGRAADYIADCFTRAQWSEARANLF